MPIFSSFLPRRKPSKVLSTRKAVIPLCPRDRSTVASTTKTSPMGAFVMNVLDPFRTHTSPFFSALVVKDATSLPAPGSVWPYPPTHSPFCSSVPASTIGISQITMWAPRDVTKPTSLDP